MRVGQARTQSGRAAVGRGVAGRESLWWGGLGVITVGEHRDSWAACLFRNGEVIVCAGRNAESGETTEEKYFWLGHGIGISRGEDELFRWVQRRRRG